MSNELARVIQHTEEAHFQRSFCVCSSYSWWREGLAMMSAGSGGSMAFRFPATCPGLTALGEPSTAMHHPGYVVGQLPAGLFRGIWRQVTPASRCRKQQLGGGLKRGVEARRQRRRGHGHGHGGCASKQPPRQSQRIWGAELTDGGAQNRPK
jgi:hypothetical protein